MKPIALQMLILPKLASDIGYVTKLRMSIEPTLSQTTGFNGENTIYDGKPTEEYHGIWMRRDEIGC